MSWRDRGGNEDQWRGLGRPGGDWQGVRPTFDNPLSWAVTLMRVAGVTVRVHLFFLLYIVIMLLRALVQHGGEVNLPEFKITALAMGVLFAIVLAHEFGHVFACRWAGGRAEEILMWPLGGLAYAQPGHRWQAHFVTAVGGPLVNVVLCVLTGLALGVLTGVWLGVAVPNPLDPFGGLVVHQVGRSWLNMTLYIINSLSLVLLLFNLLPIFPLDGGRIAQSLAWPKIGYSRSMMLAVRIGYIGAILLGIFGFVMNMMTLVGIALFGGITCYITQKQVQWTDSALAMEDDQYAYSLHHGDDPETTIAAPARPTRADRRAAKTAQREENEAREVDRILKKIAESGLESLTRNERNFLKRATERKRQGK